MRSALPILQSFFVFLAVFLFIIPSSAFAATLSAGIPKESIWFSQDPFVEGDQITIFTLLYDSSPYRLSGTVVLRDGTTTLGTHTFTLLSGGASQVFAFPWKATRGEHNFTAAIVGGKFLSGDSGNQTFAALPASQGTSSAVPRSVASKPVTPPPSPAPSTVDTTAPLGETSMTQYLSTKVPSSIQHDVLPIVGNVENFRLTQAGHANAMEGALVTTLAPQGVPNPTTNAGGWGVFTEGVTKGDVVHTPWEYVQLFFVLCYQFVTTNVYAFYILCSLILYQIVRLALTIFS